MNNLFVDQRWQNVEGSIIDIGCRRWDWTKQFSNSNRLIVGFDPNEKDCPSWAKLEKKAVSICNGTLEITNDLSDADTILKKSKSMTKVECISLKNIVEKYSPISVLKMNIEGPEYALLMTVKHPIADQLIVAFHKSEVSEGATEMMINFLSKWYDSIDIDSCLNWWLFKKK